MMLSKLAETPIKGIFPQPSEKLIAELKMRDQCVEILPQPGFVIGNDYYQQQLPGAIARVFCRAALLDRMQQLSQLLKPEFGIYFFDVFRTKATQAYLFNDCQARLEQKHPEFTLAELAAETRKYVTHPDEPERFTAPPHNTGAAIDIALVDLATGKMLNYGSPIDLSENISDTDFFERAFDKNQGLTEKEWLEARKNRRVLFNAMTHLGFTNFPSEWWHYDLGDGMWAHTTGHATIYHSMELAVQAALETEAVHVY